jgi:hypothetical protein
MKKELEAVKDKKVWETHNNRVVTLKENYRSDTSTKWWHIEEDDYDWRDDCQYVQDLIVKCEANEKELERLQTLSPTIQEWLEKYHESKIKCSKFSPADLVYHITFENDEKTMFSMQLHMKFRYIKNYENFKEIYEQLLKQMKELGLEEGE